jgi:hypothetical protein
MVLANALENVEVSLEEHLQIAKKQSSKPIQKTTSPIDALKNITFLGLFGTLNPSHALIKIRNEVKSFQVGQEILDFWYLSAITSFKYYLNAS